MENGKIIEGRIIGKTHSVAIRGMVEAPTNGASSFWASPKSGSSPLPDNHPENAPQGATSTGLRLRPPLHDFALNDFAYGSVLAAHVRAQICSLTMRPDRGR